MSSDKPQRYIVRFQVEDIGIENPSYFQGFGTSFTSYTDSTYGIGDNPREALDDMLSMMAGMLPIGANTTALQNRIMEAAYGELVGYWRGDNPPTMDDIPDSPSATEDWESEEEGEEPPDIFYHVGIRWTCEPDPLSDLRADDGTLPAYAWPGGYPLVYTMRQEDLNPALEFYCCADCANAPSFPEWYPVRAEPHYEGAPIECNFCDNVIESAYGEPDNA